MYHPHIEHDIWAKNFVSRQTDNIKNNTTYKKKYMSDGCKIVDEGFFEIIDDETLFSDISKIEGILKTLEICTNKECNNDRCKNMCIIYTNKKVGSTSLWSSINLYLSRYFKTFHFHSEGDLSRNNINDVSVTQLIKILKLYNKKIFVIDIYRPIFEICVSNYFNDISIHFQRDFTTGPEIKDKTIIVHRFLNLFNYYYNKYNVDYFKDVYNVSCEFDFTKKYAYHNNENITYIKLRLCDSHIWHEILNKYIGYNFINIKFNNTADKVWGNYYNYFNENFTISSEILDILKNDEGFKHYYTDQEQLIYLKKFENRIDDTKKFGFTDDEIDFYFKILTNNETYTNYAYLSFKSNTPLCSNCLCTTCDTFRNNIITQQNGFKQQNNSRQVNNIVKLRKKININFIR
jgi:hypothetical protein